jgi:3-oxoacyl-[acyl-carrier-protein] synthase II
MGSWYVWVGARMQNFSQPKVIQKIYFWALFRRKMYIQSFCSISPAGVLTPDTDSTTLQKISGASAPCIEPDYKDIIPPMQLRRMTKPVRTGVAAARLCMQHANVSALASIHVGTAYGMLQDSENFLQKMIVQEEQMLNPTAFIQSTHNTVAGQIALSIGCLSHNMTFVHKAHSFESALLDAVLMPQSDEPMLAGAVDELTDTSFNILERFGVYHEGNVAGEGASFFLLNKQKTEHAIAELTAFDMFIAENEENVKAKTKAFLNQNNLTVSENDMVINGVEAETFREIFTSNTTVNFKEYSGEFPTATAFALALATLKIKEGEAKRCWIINNQGKHWSVYCLDCI